MPSNNSCELDAGEDPPGPPSSVSVGLQILEKAQAPIQATVGHYSDPVNWDVGYELRLLDAASTRTLEKLLLHCVTA